MAFDIFKPFYSQVQNTAKTILYILADVNSPLFLFLLPLSFLLFVLFLYFFLFFLFLAFSKGGGGCNPLTLLLWSTTVFSLGYYISNHMCARINPRLPHTCIEYFSFNLFLCKAMIVQCYGNLRKLYGDEFIPVSWSKCFYR